MALRRFAHSQSGITIWTLALVLATIAFFTKVVVTVYPMMYNQYKVKAHLAEMAADPETPTLTPGEITSRLMKRFGQIDNVDGVNEKNLKVTRDEKTGKMTIHADYELKTLFFGPIYVVGDFHDTKVEVPAR